MRRAILLLLLTAAGCERSLIDLASGSPTPTVTTTPTPTPTPPITNGDGHDGPLIAAGTMTINGCFPVTTASGSTITSPGNSIAAGRALVVLQTQDGFAISGDTADVTAPGSAGLWELARALSVAGDAITLELALANVFGSTAPQKAQVCSIPEYTDVTIDGGATIEAPPWDGASGGLVAFYANGTVTLDGNVAAAGAGFRGGVTGGGTTETTTTGEDVASNLGGGKGEGLDSRSLPLYGRGNMANGGGGGNAMEAGGGGGSNAGAGGLGGKEDSGFADEPATQGRGGSRLLPTSLTRLFFGGGGGGGHVATVGTPSGGGDGGGAILLFVSALAGSGTATARGTGTGDTNDAGAGGGGAGGTIVLIAGTSTFSGNVNASGGDGGDEAMQTGDLDGPGGGGGGGRVRVVGVPGATVLVDGGVNGVNVEGGNVPWGATAGEDGVIEP